MKSIEMSASGHYKLGPEYSPVGCRCPRSDVLECGLGISLGFEPITEGHCFEFDPDRVHNRNHRPCLELESRQHRAELVNRQRVVAVQQHIPAPVAHPYDEHFDLKMIGSLPLSENLQNALLSVLVLHRRSLRTFVPTDHVLHWVPSILN